MDFLIIPKMKTMGLDNLIPKNKRYIAISICEVGYDNPEYPNSAIEILNLKFDDVGGGVNDHLEKNLMTKDDAQKIVDFIIKYRNTVDYIVCQCGAGISRSSATAAASSVILNGSRSDNWIFNSPKYRPNMLVYRLILNYYNDTLGQIINGENVL